MDRRRFVELTGLIGGGAAASALAGAASPFRPLARPDLYKCEGCEAIAERPIATLSSVADVAGADEPGERMILSGIVRGVDGKPAADVVIYMHQTNNAGLYANGSKETVWSRRHGRLRGWVVTGADGQYRFNTIKPAPYPDMTMPAHIHLVVGEPGPQGGRRQRPYYIDDVVFDGEFGVTPAYIRAQEFRGGSGVVKLAKGPDGVLLAVRDIRLEPHPD